jgi:hypothetical protein
MADQTCAILPLDLWRFIMDLSKYKPTPKDGGKKAAEFFKSTRKKEPSDRLVKIISEIDQPEIVEPSKKDDRAAKDAEI